MPRERTVILDSDEDIISFEHHIYDRFIRILVGFGVRDSAGNFTPSPNQNYEQIVIAGKEYEDFMKASGDRPANQFRKEDLWQPVDYMRAEVLAQRTAVEEAATVEEAPVKATKK